MANQAGAAGHAALAICESLLLSLTENQSLAVDEARAVLEDAAAANRHAGSLSADGAPYDAAAAVIEVILAGHNSVRFE